MLNGEIEWIAYFDTYKSYYGYNDTAGGEGGDTNSGKKFSTEWKLGMKGKRRSSQVIHQKIYGRNRTRNMQIIRRG